MVTARWICTFVSPYKMEIAYRGVLRGDPCSYCGAPAPARDADHITPSYALSDGTRDWQNLTASCHRCNASKGSQTLLGFLGGVGAGIDHREGERRRLAKWYRSQSSTASKES